MTLVGDLVTGQPVPFRRWRQLLENTALQEGVVGASDFKVAQRAAGATMSVDIAAGQAFIAVDTGALNGLSGASSDAVENRAVTASNATNPRVDQVILRYNDTAITTGSGNTPTIEVLAGTATAGATLDNRTGVAALPADAIRLADVLVPAASTSVTAANIRDRRPWARGAYTRIVRAVADYATTGTTMTNVDATNLAPRLECSGVPLLVSLSGNFSHSAAAGRIDLDVGFGGVGQSVTQRLLSTTAGTDFQFFHQRFIFTPSPGSSVISPMYAVAAGTGTIKSTATVPLVLTIEEIIRQNAANT